MIYDETDIGAPVTAELAGIPAVAHSLGRQLPGVFRQPALESLTQVVRAFEPDATPRDPFFANAYLDICPPGLRDPAAADPAERLSLRRSSAARRAEPPRSGDRHWCRDRSHAGARRRGC